MPDEKLARRARSLRAAQRPISSIVRGLLALDTFCLFFRPHAPLVVTPPLTVFPLCGKAVHLPRLTHQAPGAAILRLFSLVVHSITCTGAVTGLVYS